MTPLSTNKTLGTLGPEYSFHDILREEKVSQFSVEYFNSFDAIFEALRSNHIQVALVATKNSIHGTVANNAEIISSLKLTVIEVFELPISLHLAAESSLAISDVRKIYAHPVAWNECQLFLDDTHAEYAPSSSNSQALLDLRNNYEPLSAAISGREAIKQSGLKLIYNDIHDAEPNITTFSLVAKG